MLHPKSKFSLRQTSPPCIKGPTLPPAHSPKRAHLEGHSAIPDVPRGAHPQGHLELPGMDEQGKARTATALRSAGAQDSTQIASLNFITLSQFHEFNIVPGLLFV